MGFIIGLLKIIGLIVLSVLMIILLISSVLLFVPIRYQLKGKAPDYKGKGTLRWFFGILKMEFSYEDEKFHYKLRFLHFKWPNKKKLKEKKKHRKRKKKKKNAVMAKVDISQVEQQNINDKPKQKIEFSKEEKPPKKKSSFFQKFKEIVEKIRSLKDRTKEILLFLKDKENKDAIKFLFKQVIYLLCKIKPKKVLANLNFSTGDPATTGKVLGGLALIKWTYQKEVRVIPDFTNDHFYIEGDLLIKGRIYGIHFLIVAIRILMNKKIRAFLFNRG